MQSKIDMHTPLDQLHDDHAEAPRIPYRQPAAPPNTEADLRTCFQRHLTLSGGKVQQARISCKTIMKEEKGMPTKHGEKEAQVHPREARLHQTKR